MVQDVAVVVKVLKPENRLNDPDGGGQSSSALNASNPIIS